MQRVLFSLGGSQRLRRIPSLGRVSCLRLSPLVDQGPAPSAFSFSSLPQPLTGPTGVISSGLLVRSTMKNQTRSLVSLFCQYQQKTTLPIGQLNPESLSTWMLRQESPFGAAIEDLCVFHFCADASCRDSLEKQILDNTLCLHNDCWKQRRRN